MTRILSLAFVLIAAATPVAGQTLSLSPSVIQLQGTVGQSTTQTLTIENSTSLELAFELVAEDVVVVDGTRAFVAAGEIPGSIAATAVFTPPAITVPAGEKRSVTVTVTLPPRAEHRGIVALFRGVTQLIIGGKAATASLGTLMTFTMSKHVSLEPATLMVLPQSPSSNASFEQAFQNNGHEPVVPAGVAVILDGNGRMVGRANFESRRLLPGERVTMRAEYPGELRTGRYRVLATFQFEDKVITQAAALDIP